MAATHQWLEHKQHFEAACLVPLTIPHPTIPPSSHHFQFEVEFCTSKAFPGSQPSAGSADRKQAYPVTGSVATAAAALLEGSILQEVPGLN